MDETFNPRALREACVPKLARYELARRMKISWTYLDDMETGRMPFTERRKAQFLELIADYQANPPAETPYQRSGRLKRKAEVARA